MNNTLTPSQFPEVLIDILSVGLVPMIHGSPGVAKSDCVKQFCDKHKFVLIDLHLSMLEPTDLSGFPMRDGDRMTYAPLKNIPLNGKDELPKGKKGFCLFLDEINSGSMATQAAAYKLVLNRKIGDFKIHDRCVIVCAGNLATDRAIVNSLSTAMQSRLVHLFIEMNHKDWLDWANKNNIDTRIISFVKARPELLNNFDPKHNDCTFPCPRTWEFASKYISPKKNKFTQAELAVLQGIISVGTATEFKVFCEVYNTLPSIEELIDDPENVKFTDDVSVHYAMTTLISHNIDQSNIDSLMVVVGRLPLDFQIVTLRDIFSRTPHLKKSKQIEDWIDKNSDCLF